MTVDRNDAPITERTEDFGFVGYRDYKQSDFYKRYEAARAKMPAQTYAEIEGKKVEESSRVRCGVGRSVVAIVFGLIYIALGVIGYFLNTENTIVSSVLSAFDGKDLVTCDRLCRRTCFRCVGAFCGDRRDRDRHKRSRHR